MSAVRSERIAELEQVVRGLEQRLTRLTKSFGSNTPSTVDRVSDAVATAMSEIADRFRGRASTFGKEATKVSDEALELGNDALRKLTREVEQRPLILLAVAVGVGALAAGIFAARRS